MTETIKTEIRRTATTKVFSINGHTFRTSSTFRFQIVTPTHIVGRAASFAAAAKRRDRGELIVDLETGEVR